jgi:hypothetical protein
MPISKLVSVRMGNLKVIFFNDHCCWLAQSIARMPVPGETCCIYARRNAAVSLKEAAAMRRIALVFCISIALVAIACAEPSPTPKHVTSRIARQSVQSSAIAKVGYSKRRHILEIEFVNGAVYRYLDVPPSVYFDLMSAESKARFYDSNIRRHYRSVLVRPRRKETADRQAANHTKGSFALVRVIHEMLY